MVRLGQQKSGKYSRVVYNTRMDTKTASEISARLRARRAHADLTQQQAAERAGISWMTIHRCEHGKRFPTVDALYKLAAVYGCQPADFLPPLKEGK